MSHTEKIKSMLSALSKISEDNRKYFGKHTVMVPSRNEVIEIIKRIQCLIFPSYFSYEKDAPSFEGASFFHMMTVMHVP